MKRVLIPSVLVKMNKIFQQAGFKAYLVGGAVRDMLLNKKVSDYDLATDALPEQIIKLFKHVIPTGIEHGTVTVLFLSESIEVTTFRLDSTYTDSRHPDKVEFSSNIEEDLSRRDFTINAIAASLTTGELIDPFDGQQDIKKKIIRTVGSPFERFSEDGLRPIRAIRFSAKLGFEIEKNTLEAIPLCIDKTKTISVERFRDEFCKMLKSEKPSIGLKLMDETKILEYFIPELINCKNVIQGDYRGFHKFDVLDHLFYACDGAPITNLNVRIAALFHDIGKPCVKKIESIQDEQNNPQTIYTFYNHEIESAKISEKILTRLRFSNHEINYISHLIRQHMFHYTPDWSNAAVRRFIVRVTPEAINDLFDLRIADVYGMTNSKIQIKNNSWSENLCEFQDRIQAELSKNSALSLKNMAINGQDLIKLGIQPGKKIGYILNKLLETIIDNPSDNEKNKLLLIAQNIAKNLEV